jgi:hypothetical protein
MTTLTLHWPDDITASSTALFRLFARQERLIWLTLRSTSLFPSLLISISHGHCRYLRSLRLASSKRRNKPALERPQLMALATLMAVGDLPNLQNLYLDGQWVEGALAVLVDGLRNGACPKLESLGKFSSTNLQGDGINGNMGALAKFIEGRPDLPECFPIKELVGDWFDLASGEVHERLLRALIPFGRGPRDLPKTTLAIARIIKQVGAPYLWGLEVSNHCDNVVSLVPLIEALNWRALPLLEWLGFYGNGLDSACTDKLLELLRKERHYRLPPHLNAVNFQKAFVAAEDEERFFASLGNKEGIFFPSSVHFVFYESMNAIPTFASALSRGAFPGVDDLGFKKCFVKDGGMATLCQALRTAPWGKQLWRFGLWNCGVVVEDARILTNVLRQGGLPSLQELILRDNDKSGDQGVICLGNALGVSRRSTLGELFLERVGLGDEGLRVLASVAEGGCFKNLERLSLNGNLGITDRGV